MLVGAFSVIVKTDCETDGSFYSTNRDTEPRESGVRGQHRPDTRRAEEDHEEDQHQVMQI